MKEIKSTKSTFPSSTTIRISRSTKEKIENLDFVRKHTFDEILLILLEIYQKSKKSLILELPEDTGAGGDNSTTTIRIYQSTKEILENLDFVRKDTFDEILLKLMNCYEKTKRS